MIRQDKIPVTVITGFLGAGKTTFINHILKNYTDTQFALVENEFGEIAIDTKLIKGVDASAMFELKQGCICCSLTDEYELILQELADRFPHVQHLLIETTGIADPASVIQPFFRDEKLKEIYQYNGTVCLVDALNFKSSPERDILLKQIVIADLVLVTKTEDFSENKKDDLLEELQVINPLCTIKITDYGKTDVHINQLENTRNSAFEFLRLPPAHSHIRSKTLEFNQHLNKEDFFGWLEYTLDIYKNHIYRTKGIVYFQGEPFEYILQGVGGSFELLEGEILLDETISKIVFIGTLDDTNLSYNPQSS